MFNISLDDWTYLKDYGVTDPVIVTDPLIQKVANFSIHFQDYSFGNSHLPICVFSFCWKRSWCAGLYQALSSGSSLISVFLLRVTLSFLLPWLSQHLTHLFSLYVFADSKSMLFSSHYLLQPNLPMCPLFFFLFSWNLCVFRVTA